MPLFRRPDGDLVRGESPVRRIMPYLMRGRNESCVYHESLYRLGGTRPWLKAYNRHHQPRATLFHLVAYACAVALQERPRLNRFVAGGRLYQRREVSLAFVVKTDFSDGGPGATVKLQARPGEPFAAWSTRLSTEVEAARDTIRPVDREVTLVMRWPGPMVRGFVALARLLDRWNLFPGFMIGPDPMFSSLFLANLGSVGISEAYHHLYEYGTTSVFGAVSAPQSMVFPGREGAVVEPGLSIRWTFDERIDDAFSCARSLALVQRILEDPGRWLGPPEGDPGWSGEMPP